MRRKCRWMSHAGAAMLAIGLALGAAPARAAEPAVIDAFVPHVSTLAVNAGEVVPLHVHRRVMLTAARRIAVKDRVVLFVHGATVPSVAAFDFNHKTYSWMAFLARAGFDVWSVDLSGYGTSFRPMMDDPCNTGPAQQKLLQGHPLKDECVPNYPHQFKTVQNDWDEIDTVVDHIRKATNQARISLVGWSAGGPRVGGYVAARGEKINRVMLYAPSAVTPDYKVPAEPPAGAPIALQTRSDLEVKRWDPDVRCQGQLEPGVRDALWPQIMKWDRIGAQWGPRKDGVSEGVMRGPSFALGWSPEQAARIKAPLLVMVGEYDVPERRRTVYDAAGSASKVFAKVACGSHFMLWEKQHGVLHQASLEWLRDGKLQGATSGVFDVAANGKYAKVK